METISHSDCLRIGYLQKPHGVRGEVVLQFMPEFGASLEEEPVLFIEADGLLVPFFLKEEGIRFRSDETALLKFKWIDNESQARQICGLEVYIKKGDLLNEEGSVSWQNLVGFMLIDHKLGVIGPIEQIADYGGNLVIQLTYKGREVLIPFNEDFLIRFNDKKKEMEIRCPEGIFDLG